MSSTTLFIIFVSLSIINVVLNTIKSIVTVKGGIWIPALVNGLTFFAYTYVLIYTQCDLNMHLKAIVTGLVNVLGVAIVKYLEMKMTKDKVWRITVSLKSKKALEECRANLEKYNIGFTPIEKTNSIDIYSYNQKESLIVKNILANYDYKYFIQEMAKSL